MSTVHFAFAREEQGLTSEHINLNHKVIEFITLLLAIIKYLQNQKLHKLFKSLKPWMFHIPYLSLVKCGYSKASGVWPSLGKKVVK